MQQILHTPGSEVMGLPPEAPLWFSEQVRPQARPLRTVWIQASPELRKRIAAILANTATDPNDWDGGLFWGPLYQGLFRKSSIRQTFERSLTRDYPEIQFNRILSTIVGACASKLVLLYKKFGQSPTLQVEA